MSRSFRQTPIAKSEGSKKFAKKQANKKVRTSECGNGAEYRRHYNRYKIFDRRFFIATDKKSLSK